MYVHHMKKPTRYSAPRRTPAVVRDMPLPITGADAQGVMVRTQIYLTREEHGFISAEANRRGEPMAAVIRRYIEEKMQLPEAAWSENPMLDPTPPDDGFKLPEDAAINHDHYLYGTPRKYEKRRGRWVPAVPCPPTDA
mgnify:CR=1 FL=1